MLILFFFLSITAAFWLTQNSRPSITYQNTAEIGEEFVIKAPWWMSEKKARSSLRISPSANGSIYWVAEHHELHFVPTESLAANIQYTAGVESNLPLLGASLLPPVKIIRPKVLLFPPVPTTDEWEQMKRIPAQTTVINGKFIDINLETMTASLFKNGSLTQQFPVAGKGNPATWPTPEGNFTIKTKEQNHFSIKSHVWMPLSMQFYGDYFLHAWPYWPNGEKLVSKYSGGCIRLFDEGAQELFAFADIGTPVRVHSTPASEIKTLDLFQEKQYNFGPIVPF